MRLSEINYKISQLNIVTHGLLNTYASSDKQKIYNINKFKLLIKEIENKNIDFYEREIAVIKKSLIYETTSDTLLIENIMGNSIKELSDYIINSLDALNIVLNKITPERNENSFLIKLPKPNDFEELIKDMSKIQKYLQLVVSDKKINSSMMINNWEYGSYWIDIIIGTSSALSLIGSITWSAAYISKELQKNKEANLYLEKIGHENEHMKKVKETQIKYIDKLYENEILNIQENYFDYELNNERNTGLKKTIELFADILNRGGEFQPSLIAPEKMRKNFPDMNNLSYLESQVKRIAETTESGQE